MNTENLLILLGGILIGGSVPLVILRWALYFARRDVRKAARRG